MLNTLLCGSNPKLLQKEQNYQIKGINSYADMHMNFGKYRDINESLLPTEQDSLHKKHAIQVAINHQKHKNERSCAKQKSAISNEKSAIIQKQESLHRNNVWMNNDSKSRQVLQSSIKSSPKITFSTSSQMYPTCTSLQSLENTSLVKEQSGLVSHVGLREVQKHFNSVQISQIQPLQSIQRPIPQEYYQNSQVTTPGNAFIAEDYKRLIIENYQLKKIIEEAYEPFKKELEIKEKQKKKHQSIIFSLEEQVRELTMQLKERKT